MFYIAEMSDIGYIRPLDLKGDVKEILRRQFSGKYVGKYIEDLGLVLDVLEVTSVGLGKSFIGSPHIYLKAGFKVLTYMPIRDEIIEGEVENIVDYGMFVSIGPINGFVHISQLGNDVFIHRGGILQGKKKKVKFSIGDVVRAKVTAVSKPNLAAALRGEPIVRVSLTMRQPGLGKLVEEGEKVAKVQSV